MNRANGTEPRNAAPSASFYDAQSTALLLALAVLGCGPVWVLVFRSAFFYPVRNRSPLDTCIVWAAKVERPIKDTKPNLQNAIDENMLGCHGLMLGSHGIVRTWSAKCAAH